MIAICFFIQMNSVFQYILICSMFIIYLYKNITVSDFSIDLLDLVDIIILWKLYHMPTRVHDYI